MEPSDLRFFRVSAICVVSALILSGALGTTAWAGDLCATIPPPAPPPAQTSCGQVLTEFDRTRATSSLATLQDSALWTELQKLGVERPHQGLTGFPNVQVWDIKPDVLQSSQGTQQICKAFESARSLGVLTSFERNAFVKLRDADPSDPLYVSQQPALEQVHAIEAWERIRRIPPKPVLVAVVDSGIRYTHPDLVDSMWNGDPTAHGKSFVDPTKPHDTDDIGGHGTNVAGMIAATSDNGIGIASIAWHGHVQLAIARFTAGSMGCVTDLINAIHYAAYDLDARVINVSAGTYDMSVQLLEELQKISRVKRQTLIVVAVDNHELNLDDSKNPVFDYPTSFHLPNVISVQASDLNHSYLPSSYGTVSVHLAAPDPSLLTTSISSVLYTSRGLGTSISAPQVSAAAALLSEFAPHWTYSQIKQYLIDSARDPSCAPPYVLVSYDSLCGRSQSNGVLNVDAATAAPIQFTWPSDQSPWQPGVAHEVTWRVLFGTDQCREVQFLYSTNEGDNWTVVPGTSTTRVSSLHLDITLPRSIPPGTATRLAARCTDTERVERWSRAFVVE